MTSQSPRIYTYKITFEEVPYYYYGVHKEKRYNEEYWGSPKTHKWVWDFYTPKKQILQVFPYTDEGWIDAQEVEKRLIRPFYNTDKWCLNESCGGKFSLETSRENGKKSGVKNKQNKVGIFSLTKEERVINARKANETNKKNNTGIYAITPEQKREHSKKAGQKTYELGVGLHSSTPEQRIENSKKGGTISGKKHKENKTGVCGRSKKKMIEDGRKGGTISGKKHKENKTGVCGRSKEKMIEDGRKGGIVSCKIINAQRWECCETGYVSTAAGVFLYQKARGIDTSKNNRRKIA